MVKTRIWLRKKFNRTGELDSSDQAILNSRGVKMEIDHILKGACVGSACI